MELYIMKDLYQSGPANWLLSCSIDPQLEYLERDLFSVLLILVYNSIYNIASVIFQQQDTKFPVSVSKSWCNVDAVRTGAFWRELQQFRKCWFVWKHRYTSFLCMYRCAHEPTCISPAAWSNSPFVSSQERVRTACNNNTLTSIIFKQIRWRYILSIYSGRFVLHA